MESKISVINQMIDAKLNTLNQRISNIEKSISSLETCFSDYAKDQKIVFAIENSHLKSFDYYKFENNSSYSGSKVNSKDLVHDILL